MPRRRYRKYQLKELPRELELVLWGIGGISALIAMAFLVIVTSLPFTAFSGFAASPIDARQYLEPFKILIVLGGVVAGIRVRCALRRFIIARLPFD